MSEPGILPNPIPFGQYYLLERINVGGMAEVYKAKAFGEEGFERILAVKKILASIAEDEAFINMFIDEAKIAGQLNHPNIAQIFDLGKVDGSYFIALEYIGGKDLKTIFERARRLGEKVSVPRVCYTIMKVCEGLAHAHHKKDAQGQDLSIVHRDVSPQNVLISYEGEVKIIDFGIAKASGKTSQTQVGILKGKFSYMSPEQVRGLHVDNRSDIFSLGIVLYELLTLERLFLGDSDFDTLEKIRKVEMSPPSLYNPHIPKELEDIVLKALAKSPEDRFQTSYEFAEALERFMRNQGFYFTNKDLGGYMKEAFNADIEFENKKIEYYRSLNLQPIEANSVSNSPAPKNGASNGARSRPGLSWGEEEMETQIFDRDEEEISEADIIIASLESKSTVEFDRWNEEFDSEPIRKPHPTEQVPSIAPRTQRNAPPPRKKRSNIIVFVIALVFAFLGLGAFVLLKWNKPAKLAVEASGPPAVEIWINEKLMHEGKTPHEMDLDPGPTKIELKAEGFEPYVREQVIEKGKTYNLNQTLVASVVGDPDKKEEAIALRTNPAGAKIEINGKAYPDPTPFTVKDLGPGPYNIKLTKDGFFPETRELKTLTAEGLDIRMKPTKISLTVKSEPDRGKFKIYEKGGSKVIARGRTTETVKDLDASKSYKVVVTRDEYDRWEDIFEPGFDAEASVNATLEKKADNKIAEVIKRPDKKDPIKKPTEKKDPIKKPEEKKPEPTGTGVVHIQSNPVARVYIDGQDTGRYTPLLNFKIKSGKHKIKLVNSDFGLSKTYYVNIKPGGTKKIVNR